MLRTNKKILYTIMLVWLLIIISWSVSHYYQLQINVSTSMPQRFWVTHIGDVHLKRGNYVTVMFHDYRMKNANDFEYVVKQVGGMAGDKIVVQNIKQDRYSIDTKLKMSANDREYLNKHRQILVAQYQLNNIVYPVFDNLNGNRFKPLTTKNKLIPQGYYFIHGQVQPTFDSRYKEFGLINESQIYGRAYPIF